MSRFPPAREWGRSFVAPFENAINSVTLMGESGHRFHQSTFRRFDAFFTFLILDSRAVRSWRHGCFSCSSDSMVTVFFLRFIDGIFVQNALSISSACSYCSVLALYGSTQYISCLRMIYPSESMLFVIPAQVGI